MTGREVVEKLIATLDAVYASVFIFELRDGKIARETAYWAEPFEAPDWRAAWVEHADS